MGWGVLRAEQSSPPAEHLSSRSSLASLPTGDLQVVRNQTVFLVIHARLSPLGGGDPKQENQTWSEESCDVRKEGPGVGASASQKPLHFLEKVKLEGCPPRPDGAVAASPAGRAQALVRGI